MRRYKSAKEYSWSERLAYFVGLITSDGCLVNDGRHINITSKDLEIITSCQDILDKHTVAGVKKGQFGTSAYSWNFSDVKLYDFLLDIGLTPKKSKTIQKVLVPDEFWGDFLRGYFDGDGTAYGYFDQRWKSSFMFYTGFVCASKPFLDWLSRINSKLCDTTSGKIKTNTRAFTLTYAKSDSRKLYGCMYGPTTCSKDHALTRKKTKLEGFMAY